MLGRGKPRHIDPGFHDEILGRPLTDAWNRVQECDDLRERTAPRLKLGFTRGDTLFEELNMRQDVREQLGKMFQRCWSAMLFGCTRVRAPFNPIE